MIRFFSLFFAVLLLGAGCSFETAPVNLAEGGMPSPDGPITFREGFGVVPGVNPLRPQVGRPDISVSWETEIPSIPADITIIRKRKTLPESAFLQNMTSAIGIPAGALRLNPVATDLSIGWEDDQGYIWSYDGKSAKISFEKKDSAVPGTQASLPIDELMIITAERFLGNRGVDTQGWGDPSLEISWNDWWLHVQSEGYCMTRETISSLRESVLNPYMNVQDMRDLTRDTNFCTRPEFPLFHVVQFFLSQDQKIVYEKNGLPAVVAEIVIRVDSMSVERGYFYLSKDADRSNYPALSPQALIEYLRRGGVTGIPGDVDASGEIVLQKFAEGLYKHDAMADGELRTYFIPGIQATGFYKDISGNTKEFTEIVPLLREDQYKGL